MIAQHQRKGFRVDGTSTRTVRSHKRLTNERSRIVKVARLQSCDGTFKKCLDLPSHHGGGEKRRNKKKENDRSYAAQRLINMLYLWREQQSNGATFYGLLLNFIESEPVFLFSDTLRSS